MFVICICSFEINKFQVSKFQLIRITIKVSNIRKKRKYRKYDDSYLHLEFTAVEIIGDERSTLIVICMHLFSTRVKAAKKAEAPF